MTWLDITLNPIILTLIHCFIRQARTQHVSFFLIHWFDPTCDLPLEIHTPKCATIRNGQTWEEVRYRHMCIYQAPPLFAWQWTQRASVCWTAIYMQIRRALIAHRWVAVQGELCPWRCTLCHEGTTHGSKLMIYCHSIYDSLIGFWQLMSESLVCRDTVNCCITDAYLPLYQLSVDV